MDTADLIRRRLELTDEPVHEIYSTSPLLSELFDLPTVEEAATARAAAAPDKAELPGKAETATTGEPARRSRSAARRRRAAASRPASAHRRRPARESGDAGAGSPGQGGGTAPATVREVSRGP